MQQINTNLYISIIKMNNERKNDAEITVKFINKKQQKTLRAK